MGDWRKKKGKDRGREGEEAVEVTAVGCAGEGEEAVEVAAVGCAEGMVAAGAG